ncbi:MAG TPA: primosomal protein N' [bacterium]
MRIDDATADAALPYAEVVFSLPIEHPFHYAVPGALQQAAVPGTRVAAPFGRRERQGFILRRSGVAPFPGLKAIRRVLDPQPVVSEDRWRLAEWLSGYYGCSLGEAFGVMVPAALRVGPAEPDAPDEPVRGAVAPFTHVLTSHQDLALGRLFAALEAGRARAALLHGVTGSGKTELYLRVIDRALRRGQGAICLIPEIALTPQTIERFRGCFGDTVAVWHSRMTARQRSAAWQAMSCGRSRIVIGARSAVFTPIRRLGVIVLDEEHEQTYKQEDAPRYHARDVALARARVTGALVILGSATPSMESAYAARRRGGMLLELPERVEGRAMPKVSIVDMREAGRGRRSAPLSLRLQLALEQVTGRGEQALLLLNRRGFARIAQCLQCGASALCPRCSVPLIYHAAEGGMVCHYCNHREPPPEVCAHCKKGAVRFRGTGTERVESELHRVFPGASIARMDTDTTKARTSHEEFYEGMKSGKIGVLVGTQMIAKGWHFPEVTLVGVISADTALNLPDFRAGERTFDLLAQVAGRAGRGAQPGRVLVQTFHPDHYAITAAAKHDYVGFYREELKMRRRLRLPPFCHLAELTVRAGKQDRAEQTAADLADALRKRAAGSKIEIIGPAPHRIPKMRRTYRMCVLLKHKSVEPIVELIRHTLQPGRRFAGLPVAVDVDPS